ncbi:conserved hypothetical protein [uncultured Desulfatiglans sp.]|uniref:DUF169 domain-containing protein n=1 Tax=Uncultured Desulfatiglans sp. TaxID=1748965 RepID=A0A653AKC9_UNCDX|nr:conserved hypothetical protein [uncultured Desulfatiglans sp.]
MESKIAQALNLKYHPVAILWSDDRPEKAMGFKQGKWGCVMWMLAAAAKGRTAAFDKSTYGCWGGGVGLGFGNQYLYFPGGIECFYPFLSTGNENRDTGRAMAKKLESAAGKDFLEEFRHGEGYIKTPELVKRFIDTMPIMEVPKKYVVFKPLSDLDPGKEQPQVIVFLADPDQLSALVVLANYGREGNENVIIPFAAGCQQIGIFAYREARSERPRGVIGLTDLSARKNLKKQLDRNLLSFAVPWRMFEEMEDNVEGSFLQKETWRSLQEPGIAGK